MKGKSTFQKKIRFKLWLSILFISILICSSGLFVNNVKAASGMTLQELQAKFPAGAYWNHAGSNVNNPDGYTYTPCNHHGNCSKGGKDYTGSCGCNSFGLSIQCFGFANKLAYDAFGSTYTSWSKSKSLGNLKAGDVIRYKNDNHSIFVTGVSGNIITYADCNWDEHCQIRWNQTISKETVARTLEGVYSAPRSLNVSAAAPTNPQISKSQVWYDLGDTIAVSACADNATGYYMSMFKDGEKIVGQGVDGGKFSMPANRYGKGHYTFYFSCSNSAGTVDTSWLDFDVVGKAGYKDVWTSKPIYDLNDTVSISVSTICAKGQVIGIDKWGVGRVVTTGCDSTYTISASELGVGTYSAYFTVCNGSGNVDTKYVDFIIADRGNLGDQFYAQIKNPGIGKYVSNIKGNVKGEDIDCDRSRTWLFTRQSDGSYKIISSLDYGAMDVADYGNAGNGTNIQMNSNWDTTAQRFYIYKAWGAYYIKPVCCEMFLDMGLNEPHNLATWGGGVDWAPQKFEIIKVNSDDVGVHKYKPKVTKEPTCKEEGTQTYTCSLCGDFYTKSIGKKEHQYSKEWTIDIEPTCLTEGSKSHHCTICDEKKDVTIIPRLEASKDKGRLSLSETSGAVGDVVDVYINLENNPGIVGTTLAVAYDTAKLQLISCEDLGVLNDYQFSDIDHKPFLLNWEDPLAEEDNTANGNIAKLKFKILKDLGEEGTSLQLSIDTIYDVNIKDVEFETKDGKIMMKKYAPGDVNEDGAINSKDSILLRKYILGADIKMNLGAADVNRDGAVNSKDSIILRKYILGGNVVLQ